MRKHVFERDIPKIASLEREQSWDAGQDIERRAGHAKPRHIDGSKDVDDGHRRREADRAGTSSLQGHDYTQTGGSIWLESAPGEGTRFHFTLPIEPGRD